MCGIAGRLTAGEPIDPAAFEAVVAALRHRGPDAQAVSRIDPACHLGHCRLSVIDPSSAANQPFRDETGRYALVFNGEIYNFPELRGRLEGLGRRFRTRSDTEVVLHALIEWGIDALPLFNGMFAFGFYDREARRLLLARDRFGKKPLYYRQTGRQFSFASELTPLRVDPAGGAPAGLSLAGLNHFLALGYTLHPLTICEGIFKLPPASWMTWERGTLSPPRAYWDYARCFRERFAGTPDEAVEALEARLDEAVRRRLVSDVPLGVFLSGGLDSSTVAYYASRHAAGRLETFCLGFANPSYDESGDARRVAGHLGAAHHELRFDSGTDRAAAAIDAWDEPFSDTSLLPTHALCRQTRRHVTVALSGDGADELFAGYPTHAASLVAAALQPVPAPLRRALGALLRRIPLRPGVKTPLSLKLRRFGRGIAEPLPAAHYAWRLLHDLDERIALIGPDHADLVRESDPAHRFAELFRRVADLPPLNRCLYVDGLTWLTDDILVKTDRAAMAFGLEVRCPFLDPAVAGLAASLPPAWKWSLGRGKRLLRRLVARRLPPWVLAKRKAGFNAPVRELTGHGAGANGAPGGTAQAADEFTSFNRYVYDTHHLTRDRAAGRGDRP